MMNNMKLADKTAILSEKIKEMGYENLRYSIFSDNPPQEWETRIEYNLEKKEYEVYSTMDRASKGGIYSFKEFDEAVDRFLKNLSLTVLINKKRVEEGKLPEYYSPLWNEKK